MQIKPVTISDIPHWKALSSEYDDYVKELVDDLKEWYEGNDNSLAFTSYIESKITKHEAFIAFDSSNHCLGIVAFSKHNNSISFFGVSHDADFLNVGSALLMHAFKHLDATRDICINEITSQSQRIEQHRKLFVSFGFLLI